MELYHPANTAFIVYSQLVDFQNDSSPSTFPFSTDRFVVGGRTDNQIFKDVFYYDPAVSKIKLITHTHT